MVSLIVWLDLAPVFRAPNNDSLALYPDHFGDSVPNPLGFIDLDSAEYEFTFPHWRHTPFNTKQPPTEVGGFELRTESPDTG
jgi:hypothetical protein